MQFKLQSNFLPTGDQPEAIRELTEGLDNNVHAQTLLGVTGSGKTFTIANVIQHAQRPTLILSHNKTLAAQLYEEFKAFFPKNRVEYFVSFYDYFQPETYLPNIDKYIDKDFSINDEIDRYRMSTVSALMSGRRDVIVIATVSAIFGAGNPTRFLSQSIDIHTNGTIERNTLLRKLNNLQYTRNDIDTTHAQYSVCGDNVMIHSPYSDDVVRVSFWGDTIDSIEMIDSSGACIESLHTYKIYPARMYLVDDTNLESAITAIMKDLDAQVAYFKGLGKQVEADRIKQRTMYDIQLLREMGYCKGIENYSRYFDNRKPGTPPSCLIDYFPKDFLMIVDESHAMIPQIRAMGAAENFRKNNLIEYGFRLPSSCDNRPLKFDEFESKVNQVIFVSATPAQYELQQSEGIIVDQVIRPTGLLDPQIEVRPSANQIDDLMNEIQLRIDANERVLVTTLTKRMAEELSEYLSKYGVSTTYMHSDIDTFDRISIINKLRNGDIDVLVGVNLLREGLDIPEVSLVVILDADKEGFLRNEKSLTQIVGRAARNVHGKAIMYADTMTDSMQRTIDETNRRRRKQMEYNTLHNITPRQISKSIEIPLLMRNHKYKEIYKNTAQKTSICISHDYASMKRDECIRLKNEFEREMKRCSQQLNFIEAAMYRDEIIKISTYV